MKKVEIICRVEGSQHYGFRCAKRYDWAPSGYLGLSELAQIKKGKQICGGNAESCKKVDINNSNWR
jgi:hypothetical protein